MDTKYLKKTLTLSPHMIDHNYLDTILDILRMKEIGSCTKEYGYILCIEDMMVLSNNVISNGYISFNLQYKAIILKPKVDDIILCKIVTITKDGILASISNLNVIITSNSLSDQGYTYKEGTYIKESTPNKAEASKNTLLDPIDYGTLRVDSKIRCKIIAVKYIKRSYKCIALLY